MQKYHVCPDNYISMQKYHVCPDNCIPMQKYCVCADNCIAMQKYHGCPENCIPMQKYCIRPEHPSKCLDLSRPFQSAWSVINWIFSIKGNNKCTIVNNAAFLLTPTVNKSKEALLDYSFIGNIFNLRRTSGIRIIKKKYHLYIIQGNSKRMNQFYYQIFCKCMNQNEVWLFFRWLSHDRTRCIGLSRMLSCTLIVKMATAQNKAFCVLVFEKPNQ